MQLFPALPPVVRGMFRRPEALAVCPPGGAPRERGMFLNQTANYGLSQWEATDRILMEDFNSDNSKIDAALTGLDTRAAALEAAAGGFGNCRIEYKTYTGSGSGSNTLTFSGKPLFVFVTGATQRQFVYLVQGATLQMGFDGAYSRNMSVSWSDNSVTWYNSSDGDASFQCNLAGQTYMAVAFLAAGE